MTGLPHIMHCTQLVISVPYITVKLLNRLNQFNLDSKTNLQFYVISKHENLHFISKNPNFVLENSYSDIDFLAMKITI